MFFQLIGGAIIAAEVVSQVSKGTDQHIRDLSKYAVRVGGLDALSRVPSRPRTLGLYAGIAACGAAIALVAFGDFE